jgi:sporulation protein YtfJ
MSHTLNDLMSGMLDRLRGMADADVVIGKAITTPEGITVLPVSKVSIGVVSGGLDFVGKNSKSSNFQFGGGGGTGLSVEPIAFLIASKDGVRLLPISAPGGGPLDRIIDMVPGVLEKAEGFFKKEKDDV